MPGAGTDEEIAEAGIRAMEDFYHEIGMPVNMRELGIAPTDGQIEEMAERCMAASGGGFAGAVMKKLCVGRHLFQGDNLYVGGACYCAREMSGERRLEEFVYLDEDTVEVNISIHAYTDGKPQEILLVRAGTPWHQIDHEIDLIPDGDRELELNVKNMRTKDKTKQCIPMEGIPGRTDRRARIGLQLRFAGKEKCIVTVRDKGFGDFYPSSCRIWEKTITIE